VRAPVLTLERVSVERSGRTVVEDISFDVAPGEIALLIGHNGSGKSSLLNCVAGLLPAAGGKIFWHRRDEDRLRPPILLQETSVFEHLTVAENIACGACNRFRPAHVTRSALRDRAAKDFPIVAERWRQRAGTLSGGGRRLVALERVLHTPSNLLLLDEPTVGLAQDNVYRTLDLIEAQAAAGSAVLMVEHLGLARRIATRLCIMRNGRMVYNGEPSLADDEDKLRGLYL
jgi:ABC-type branched-subunit amino acid transport system ATPase component